MSPLLKKGTKFLHSVSFADILQNQDCVLPCLGTFGDLLLRYLSFVARYFLGTTEHTPDGTDDVVTDTHLKRYQTQVLFCALFYIVTSVKPLLV